MIGRRQLAVASPISGPALARAAFESIRPSQRAQSNARGLVQRAFGARSVILTDSGTSALALALRVTVGQGATVGLPAYGCVDLVAAALLVGVRVRLYDIDPATLSPDLDSVRRMMQRGIDAIVVAHLFGYASDVVAVQSIAAAAGVPVIEDAAQGAGGSLHGKRLGSFGDLSVVSFGRGKGLCAGGGGALLGHSERWRDRLEHLDPLTAGKGLGGLASTVVQWMLGRPSMYALPSALPWLHLGEMVFHPAHEPQAMSAASSSLVASAFSLESRDVAIRRANAHALDASVDPDVQLGMTTPLTGSLPGYLRYAVRDLTGQRKVQPVLGVVKPYPGTVGGYSELAPALLPEETDTPGAFEIGRSLFTLPTHRFVKAADLARLTRWMNSRSPSVDGTR